MVPAGAQGPGFLMLQNFRAIMKYNPSEAYALAIGHLADRLRGGEPFVQAWPRHERVLTRAERLELQQHLARGGYDVGEPDGRFGPRTRNALRAFQVAVGHRAGWLRHRLPLGAAAQPVMHGQKAGTTEPMRRRKYLSIPALKSNQPPIFQLTFLS